MSRRNRNYRRKPSTSSIDNHKTIRVTRNHSYVNKCIGSIIRYKEENGLSLTQLSTILCIDRDYLHRFVSRRYRYVHDSLRSSLIANKIIRE